MCSEDFVIICSVTAGWQVAGQSHATKRQNVPMVGQGWDQFDIKSWQHQGKSMLHLIYELYPKYCVF